MSVEHSKFRIKATSQTQRTSLAPVWTSNASGSYTYENESHDYTRKQNKVDDNLEETGSERYRKVS